MKSQNCTLINFVTDGQTHTHTHGQAESNMPLQLLVGGIIKFKAFTKMCDSLSM